MRIQKREHSNRAQRRIARGILAAACTAVMVWCMPIISLADATGKIIPKSVNIRKTADVNSEKVGSTAAGKSVTIKGKVDASGGTWYQVVVDANTVGYIRSDMVEVENGADIPAVTPASSSDGQSSELQAGGSDESQGGTSSGGAQTAADESVDLQYAKIKVNAKVRPDPSTKQTPVASLAEGSQVVVSGKSAGGDGKTWYYVTYTSSNGSENTGFIREDLLELGELLPVEEAPPQEEAPEETPEPEPVVNNDYVLRLEQSEAGAIWYLDDNIKGETRELEPLLQSAYSRSEVEEEAAKSVVKQRIVIVVMAVLLVALIVTVVIMALKLRDAYYEDYEDDEDEEDEEDEEEDDERPVRRRVRGEESEEDRPVRRREISDAGERRRSSERGERRPSRERAYEEDASQDRPAKAQASKRKPKNFLLDDDEFEFEFLNMDDKDLM